MRSVVLGGLGVVLALAGCTRSATAQAEKTLEAYGGRDVLSKKVAIKQDGSITSTRYPGRLGGITRGFYGPDKLRVEVVYPGVEPEVRILDGQVVWRQGRPASGPPKDAVILQGLRLALPELLLAHLAELQDQGFFERDGQKLRRLALPVGEKMSLTVEIDPATGHMVRSASSGEGIEFITDYDDFRTVGGRLFAFHEVNTAMGQPAGEIRFETIEVLDSFPPEVFRP